MSHTTTHRPSAPGNEMLVDDGYAFLRRPDDEATVALRSGHVD
jgi:hypothetical protein